MEDEKPQEQIAMPSKPPATKAAPEFSAQRQATLLKVAEILKAYRERSGLSLREAARRAGCGFRVVHTYEMAERKYTDLSELSALCRVYGVTLARFLRDLGLD